MPSLTKWMSGLLVSALAGCGPIDAAPPELASEVGVESHPGIASTVSTKQSLVAPPPTLQLGVFRQQSGGYYLWAAVSWAQLEAKAQELAGSGLHLVDLNIRTASNGTVTYDGAWLPGTGTYALRAGLSWSSFVAQWQTLGGQGLRLVDLEVYVEGGVRKYAGVWRAGTDGYGLWSGVGQADFESKVREWETAGLRLVDVEAFWEGNDWKFTGVFRQGTGGQRLVLGQDWSSFVSTWQSEAANGLLLTDLRTYSAPAWESKFSEALEGGAMGYSYAIVEGGLVTRSGGVGYARAPYEQSFPGVAMTANTRMHLASVSKPITATALVQVAERRNISLDAPFYPYVRSRWPVAAAGVQNVTLRQLLTHRSGMAAWGYCGNDFNDSMRQLIAAPMAATPGTTQTYSNGNFCLLRAVIEAISGVDYEQYVKSNVFQPMGITGMSCAPDATAGTLYYASGVRSAGFFWPENYGSQCGAYGWYASATDLAKFLIGIRQHTVLSAAATQAMLGGELGWWFASTPGGSAHHHNGAWITGDGRGCNTGIIRLPNGVEAVLLSNTNGFDTIGTLLNGYNASPYAL